MPCPRMRFAPSCNPSLEYIMARSDGTVGLSLLNDPIVPVMHCYLMPKWHSSYREARVWG